MGDEQQAFWIGWIFGGLCCGSLAWWMSMVVNTAAK